MRSYRQFCPVAKAAEIFAERWTPLIIRELLMGSHRFNELQLGLPAIPRSLLVKRLRALEQAGLLVRKPAGNGRATEYHLTRAGEELLDVVERLGQWGQKWVNSDIRDHEIDPKLLMWDMRRRVRLDKLPGRRVVVQFDLRGEKSGSHWLVLDRGDVSVCFHNPGYEVDLFVEADTLALHRVWMGRLTFDDALRRRLIRLSGPAALVRAFPGWLQLSSFAPIPAARGASKGAA